MLTLNYTYTDDLQNESSQQYADFVKQYDKMVSHPLNKLCNGHIWVRIHPVSSHSLPLQMQSLNQGPNEGFVIIEL